MTDHRWAAARAMVKLYGDDALLEATARADQLIDDGNPVAAANWHRIVDAIEQLQAQKRMKDFDEKLSRIQKGFTSAYSLIQMEEAWVALVDECEEGYNWCISEFNNDISVRDRIELVLSREDLLRIPAVEHLRAVVGSVDGRFRALLRNDVNNKNGDAPWWRRGVLKYAGEEYAQDVRSLYGIEIETPDNDPP
jgi:hypothetical protein